MDLNLCQQHHRTPSPACGSTTLYVHTDGDHSKAAMAIWEATVALIGVGFVWAPAPSLILI
jgi:hypothetical protein